MNFSTISSMFGINPNNFKPADIEPIRSDAGFVYYLEQDTKKIPCPFCNSLKILIVVLMNIKKIF